MNRWVEESIRLASSSGYLDKLTKIYPSVPSERPELPSSTRRRIEELQGEGKDAELVSLLVHLKSHPFPFEHPYVSLLRAMPKLIELNPRVVADIGSILRKLGPKGVIEGCERPPDLNRQMGHSFQSWLRRYFPTRGYKFLDEYAFGTYDGNCFLSGGDKRLTAYANRYLGCELRRNRDMLAKVKGRYIIAEARFLSSGGGSQSRDVRETIGFVKDKTGNATRIAVLDGMTWFDHDMLSVIRSLDDDEVGLSALLLEEYFDSLR